MKLAKIGLAIITSLALMALICLPVQASEDSGEVDLSATGSLTISDVSASNISYHGATISWTTNGDATSQVFYGTTSTVEDIALVSKHSVRLTGLSSGRTYHYRVRSAIPDTEFIAISEDYTFRTSSPAPPGPTPPIPEEEPEEPEPEPEPEEPEPVEPEPTVPVPTEPEEPEVIEPEEEEPEVVEPEKEEPEKPELILEEPYRWSLLDSILAGLVLVVLGLDIWQWQKRKQRI